MTHIQRIDEQLERVQTEFAPLNQQELNWKFNADKWSIAQCLDHIMVSDNQYAPILNGVVDQSYPKHWAQKIPLYHHLFGNMILSFVQPDRKKHVKTLPIFEPSQSDLSEKIVEEFHQHVNSLKSRINRIDGLNLDRIIISSPANSYFTMSAQKALDIIVSHTERHINQAMEVKEHMLKANEK